MQNSNKFQSHVLDNCVATSTATRVYWQAIFGSYSCGIFPFPLPHSILGCDPTVKFAVHKSFGDDDSIDVLSFYNNVNPLLHVAPRFPLLRAASGEGQKRAGMRRRPKCPD